MKKYDWIPNQNEIVVDNECGEFYLVREVEKLHKEIIKIAEDIENCLDYHTIIEYAREIKSLLGKGE